MARLAVALALMVVAAVNGFNGEPIRDADDQTWMPPARDPASIVRRLAESLLGSTSVSGSPKPKTVGDGGGSPASRHNALRFKLASAACPGADAADKELLVCKNWDISRKIKSAAKDEEKKAYAEERKKLYAAAASKSTEDKKKASATLKAFFTRAYASWCQGAHATTEVCMNEEMKRLYSGSQTGARKARRAKKA